MAYNNQGGSSRQQTFYQNLGSVFGDKKCYTLGVTDKKFKLAIASAITNNGKQEWDFRNSTNIFLDHEDLNRLYVSCKKIYHIVTETEKDPELIKQGGEWAAVKISFPLVAKSTGSKYGEFTVGITQDPVQKDKSTFAFSYSYQDMQSQAQIKDVFVFVRSTGLAGDIRYIGEDGTDIMTTHSDHWSFESFINNVEALLYWGRLSIAQQKAISMSHRGSGGYNRGTASGGDGDSQSHGGNYDDDIPF